LPARHRPGLPGPPAVRGDDRVREPDRGGRFRRPAAREETYAGVVEILRDTGLLQKANWLAGSLTLLDRKRLELARALATRPRLLLLDEIAGGLTEHESVHLVEELRRIKRQGVTMLWIEHVVHALVAVADRLLVVTSGGSWPRAHPRQ